MHFYTLSIPPSKSISRHSFMLVQIYENIKEQNLYFVFVNRKSVHSNSKIQGKAIASFTLRCRRPYACHLVLLSIVLHHIVHLSNIQVKNQTSLQSICNDSFIHSTEQWHVFVSPCSLFAYLP